MTLGEFNGNLLVFMVGLCGVTWFLGLFILFLDGSLLRFNCILGDANCNLAVFSCSFGEMLLLLFILRFSAIFILLSL